MKIGIYLGYAPYIKPMSLKQEGLGRYLSFLLKGFTQSGNQLMIACPNWVIPLVEELIAEEDIDASSMEILTSSTEPILFKAYVKWINRKHKPKTKRGRLSRAVINWTDRVLDVFLRAKNIAVLIILLVLCGLLGIVALPFLFFGGIIYGFARLVKTVLQKLFHVSVSIMSPRKILGGTSIEKNLEENWNGVAIQEKIRRYSTDEIIKKARHMKNRPDVWYSPTAFWNEFNLLPGVRVTCVPDLVTTEFPTKFSQGHFADTTERISGTIKNGRYFITYCDYLRDSLLLGKYFKDKSDVAVITHAQNDMLPFLNLEKYFERVPFKEDVNTYFAKNIVLPGVLAHSVNMGPFLIGIDSVNNFSFADVDYIFYPSQVRGNKNILNLVKAYEYLLRSKDIRVKLVLTCNINNDEDLHDYIYDNRLQYDVLSFNSVTAQQLAALYMCAKLVVNPTLYEGGFPFTFGEGMSVGTPSVMSNIPQVMEVMQGYNLEEYLFNPYDYLDMATKIARGLENREKLVIKEQVLYDQLKFRMWKDVCGEYIQAFEYFINRSKENETQVQD